jgi:serine/threonine-protein kinase
MKLDALAADWARLAALLDEALERPPQARAAWLAALPAEHAALRPVLARLLEGDAAGARATGDAETGDWLEAPPAILLDGDPDPPLHEGPSETPGAAPAAGRRIGPWRLVRELGAGGMASVWLAERADGSLKRPVALKLPHATWHAGLAARLARERDILATLDHPHIARLLDAGLDDFGRPWLALEQVAGEPILAWCAARGLGVRDRVRLVVQAADAVAYAHGRLVIHRDLKPSNLLVADDGRGGGQLKLLDFGIAKLLAESDAPAEATALTAAMGRAYTPAYASPEQRRGEPLSTATGVHSLGVLAIELLTGSRPVRPAENEPLPAASRLATDTGTRAQLAGDLDAVFARATAALATDRYAGMEAFARDLRAWLAGEAVAARPEPAAARARRFVRRHRVVVASTAAVVIALAAGTTLALRQAAVAREAAARAQQEAATAAASQRFVESVFAANSGDVRDPAAARQRTARELLDAGAARLATELADEPAVRLRLTALMARMYEDLTLLPQALDMQAQRVELAAALEPGGDEHVAALGDTAHAHVNLEQLAEAAARLDEAEALLRANPPVGDAARLRVAIARASLHRADDPPRGLAAAEAGLEIARRMPPSKDLVLLLGLAGENALYAREPARAVAPLQEAIALLGRDPALGASVLSAVHGVLGEALNATGDVAGGERQLRLAIEAGRAQGAEPLHWAPFAAKLASLLLDRGRGLEAEAALAEAAALVAAVPGTTTALAPYALAVHGRALAATGRSSEGLARLDDAAARAASLGQAQHFEAGIAAFRAIVLARLGRSGEAQAAVADAERYAKASPAAPQRWIELARREVQVSSGRAAEAVAGFARWRLSKPVAAGAASAASAGAVAAPFATDDPIDAVPLAEALLLAGRPAEAAPLVQMALADFERPVMAGLYPVERARARAFEGWIALAEGRSAQAAASLADATARLRAATVPTHAPELAQALALHAAALARLGRAAEAAAARREAAAIRARHPSLSARFDPVPPR